MVTPSTGRSHCKHKEQLAHFTNVSVTTLESETESEQSFASTICTQITGKAQIRSFPSLQTYFLENQWLNVENDKFIVYSKLFPCVLLTQLQSAVSDL